MIFAILAGITLLIGVIAVVAAALFMWTRREIQRHLPATAGRNPAEPDAAR